MLQIPYPQNFILQKKGRKKQHSSLMGYFDLRKVCMLRYKRSKVQKASSIMFPTKCHFYITCNLVDDVASFKLKLAAQDQLIIPCILFTLRIQSFFPLLPQQQVESLPVAKQQAASKGEKIMMKMKKMQVSILRGWSPQGVASRRAAPKKALVPMHARSSVVKVSSGVHEGPHCDIMSICTPFCLLKSALIIISKGSKRCN